MELAERNLLLKIPMGMRMHHKWHKKLPSFTLVFYVPSGIGDPGQPDIGDLIRSIYEYEEVCDYEIQSLEIKSVPDSSPARPVIIVCDVIQLNT